MILKCLATYQCCFPCIGISIHPSIHPSIDSSLHRTLPLPYFPSRQWASAICIGTNGSWTV